MLGMIISKTHTTTPRVTTPSGPQYNGYSGHALEVSSGVPEIK